MKDQSKNVITWNKKFLFLFDLKAKESKEICNLNLRTLAMIISVFAITIQIPAFALASDLNVSEISIIVFNTFALLAFITTLYSAFRNSPYLLNLGFQSITLLTYIYCFGGLALNFIEAFVTVPERIAFNRRNNNLVGDPFVYGPINKGIVVTILTVSWFVGLLISLFINYVLFHFQKELNVFNEEKFITEIVNHSSLNNTTAESFALIN